MNPTQQAATSGLPVDRRKLDCLRMLEQRILWLSTWMIHNANHLRPKRDALKVGGHQASSASCVTLMTALFFDALTTEDRIAVKPHASPVFHAIQYLLGHETRDRLERFRAFGGAQSYPSRTKDFANVDFSTGSEGLGAGITIFAAMARQYVQMKGMVSPDRPLGRMVALMGDAEFDEGNVFEAMLEGWKHDVRNVWWVIDYNRQSLDRILDDDLSQRMEAVFRAVGWNVRILKYGRRLEEAFARPGGESLRKWLDACPNDVYSALVYEGGDAWRKRLRQDIGHARGIRTLLADYDDVALARLMTDLAGHDMETLMHAFNAVDDDHPQCFIAYTIKGFGLPFAGHKDNHAGLLSVRQMAELQQSMGIPEGAEWEPFIGLGEQDDVVRRFIKCCAFASEPRRTPEPQAIAPVNHIHAPAGKKMSTQEALGRILTEISTAHPDLAAHIVTLSPDVTVSTNLGGWVNRRGVFGRTARNDVFKERGLGAVQRWIVSAEGQHIELGIAENNLFLALGALGLTAPLFGTRLLPIGTIYDTFIPRGLDALNYGCYQDSRFIVVGTPSGISLAPEGGAHQAVTSPLIGIGQPNLTSFEPAYADETAAILEWALEHLQKRDGSSVYLRLSTRPLPQPDRKMSDDLRDALIQGGYWLIPPRENADVAIVCSGVVAVEVVDAYEAIRDEVPGIGVAVLTSADRLHADWSAQKGGLDLGVRRRAHVETLLDPLSADARIITVIDGHPAALSWLGSVRGQRVHPLGVTRFGQSGDIPDLYREYRIDSAAIIDTLASVCLDLAGWTGTN